MVTELAAVAVVIAPLLSIVILLRLAERIHRARQAVVGVEAAVTAAIHRELGAVVAPTVRRRLGGRWQVLMTVPLARPALVERLVEIVHETLAGAPTFEIVLSPAAPRFGTVEAGHGLE